MKFIVFYYQRLMTILSYYNIINNEIRSVFRLLTVTITIIQYTGYQLPPSIIGIPRRQTYRFI